MGLFGGPRQPKVEDRGIVLPEVWNLARGGDYAAVDPTVGETSLQSVAVRSTADLVCSLGSELPVDVFTGFGSDRRKVSTPGNLEDPGDDGTGLPDWVYRLLISWLLRGNAFEVETSWDRRGRATHADLLHPDDVTVTVVDGAPQWRVNGKPVTEPGAFVHRRVNPVPGRLLGLSIIAAHAASIGVSLSATQFGRQWFQDGAHPSGMLKNTEVRVTPEVAATAKRRFIDTMRGTREPLILGKGWEYQQIQVAPNESQFLETSKMTEAQCARMFGPGFAEILGYESGTGMTYNNVSARRTDLLVLSMNKWLRRVERVLSDLLPPQQYARLNRDALLEATTLDRYQAHQYALQNKWRTVNEVRAIEDLPPVPWGDVPMTSGVQGGDAGGI